MLLLRRYVNFFSTQCRFSSYANRGSVVHRPLIRANSKCADVVCLFVLYELTKARPISTAQAAWSRHRERARVRSITATFASTV